ncbi:MAG: pyridoxamine 5'-phosphate oxidase family protein [Candidatus Latescibacterota bacterium]
MSAGMRRKDRQITEPGELRGILTATRVCRIAFAHGDTPYIVPLNFGWRWDGDRVEDLVLYFHCAREGRKLELMGANPRVAFEMDLADELVRADRPCKWGVKYRSLVGLGRLERVAGAEERREGLDRIMEHHGARGPFAYDEATLRATLVLRLRVSEMTGKKVG